MQSKGRLNTSDNGTNVSASNWVPLLDEDKFGLNTHDLLFVIRNMDDDKVPNMNGSSVNGGQIVNEVYWTSTGDNAAITEVQLQKKGEPHRKVMVGINIEYECKNSQCKLNGKKSVK